MLQVAIIGQDTLAKATAECCCRHFQVPPTPYGRVDVLWVCYDTPIGPDGNPDSEWVMDRLRAHMVDFDPHPLILVSAQMPVGTTAQLEREFPAHRFAHSPENIRVATAVKDFENQARIVVGTRTTEDHQLLAALFAPFTKNVIYTTPETAECVKHFLNCYLGMSIAFANEMARVAKVVGADPDTISLALRTDQRVSPKAPLRAGAPFGGGHLARDIFTVTGIARRHSISIPIIGSIMESNGGHQ